MSRKERPKMPEMPESELRPADNGTGSAVELDAGAPPYPTVPYQEDSGLCAGGGNRELAYVKDTAEEQYLYAAELFAAGKPYVMACPTNLPTGTIRGRALLVNALQPGDVKLKPGEVLRLRCCYWVIAPDRVPNRQTGEVEQVTRTSLITKDGEVYRTTSEYAPRRLVAMNEAFTPEEIERGIPLIITAKPSTTYPGGTWHDIRVDLDALPDAP